MSKRQNEHTNDDRASVGLSPPKPAIEVLDPPPQQPEMPEWQRKAMSPEVQQLVTQLMGRPKNPASESTRVRDAQVTKDPRDAGQARLVPTRQQAMGKLWVTAPRLTNQAFAGLSSYFDKAIDTAGINRAGDNGTLISKAKKFDLTVACRQRLELAMASTSTDDAMDLLAYVARIRAVLQCVVDGIDLATADVERALGITETI